MAPEPAPAMTDEMMEELEDWPPPTQCTATTQEGRRCRQWTTTNESGFCLFHDPARIAERRAAQSKGGINGGLPVLPDGLPPRPRTLADLTDYLSWILDATGRGQLDKDTAAKMTYTATAMRGALVQRDLEATVAKLREELKAAKRGAA